MSGGGRVLELARASGEYAALVWRYGRLHQGMAAMPPNNPSLALRREVI